MVNPRLESVCPVCQAPARNPWPVIVMPSFGDSRMLTDQEIADLIAYVISLNTLKEQR